eukprot:COSAG06_NODE_43148_length_374_cov_4.323636_1_plen_59_part_10
MLQTAAREAIPKRRWRWNVARGPKRRPVQTLTNCPLSVRSINEPEQLPVGVDAVSTHGR